MAGMKRSGARREPVAGERSDPARTRSAWPVATRLALGGVALWSAALILGPVVRPDLDLVTSHPEDYARGPWGFLMRLGYAGIAVAAGAASYLARRFRVSSVLLAVFAVGALGIGIMPPTGGDGLADQVFPYLQYAPLAFFPAIARISWRVRRRPLPALAVLSWALFLPLVIGDPPGSGLLNRAADLALGAWIAAYAVTPSPDAASAL